MAPAPHEGHAAQDQGHKPREVGAGHHHAQRYPQKRWRENRGQGNTASPLHLFSLICKGLTVQGVNSECIRRALS
jgi:hypothetical protein